MSLFEIFLVGVGLAMDAFAVSVTNGMCVRGKALATAAACGLCFGVFQGIMPAAGYLLGSAFIDLISRFDHIIALVLLCYIGGKMVYDSFKGEESPNAGSSFLSPKTLILQGVATSIDALAVGVSFSTLLGGGRMALSAVMVALTTFVISFAGVFVGKRFGDALSGKATLVGGAILIAIGVKIFIEHTFFS